MNDDIDKADRIVGLTIAISHDWGCPSLNSWRDKIRRGAYCEWLVNRPNNASIVDSVESLAAEVVRIDAEERRKEPDDGLPPGPWIVHEGMSPAHTTYVPRAAISANRREFATFSERAQADYFARCGSPAVRRLLAAYDVTEEAKDVSQFSNALCMSNNGNVWLTTSPGRDCRILCWLTPRSKP